MANIANQRCLMSAATYSETREHSVRHAGFRNWPNSGCTGWTGWRQRPRILEDPRKFGTYQWEVRHFILHSYNSNFKEICGQYNCNSRVMLGVLFNYIAGHDIVTHESNWWL
ncbi:hypothetical protein BC938DRAFT_477910, partial [Jimgerdemannia flammicorona]